MKQKLAVAVDLGTSNVRVALVSPNGEILQKLKEKTAKTGANGNVVTKQIERLAQQSKVYRAGDYKIYGSLSQGSKNPDHPAWRRHIASRRRQLGFPSHPPQIGLFWRLKVLPRL